jgi:hypothetical protein
MPKITQTTILVGVDQLTMHRVDGKVVLNLNGHVIELGLDDLEDLIEELRDLRQAVREYDMPF